MESIARPHNIHLLCAILRCNFVPCVITVGHMACVRIAGFCMAISAAFGQCEIKRCAWTSQLTSMDGIHTSFTFIRACVCVCSIYGHAKCVPSLDADVANVCSPHEILWKWCAPKLHIPFGRAGRTVCAHRHRYSPISRNGYRRSAQKIYIVRISSIRPPPYTRALTSCARAVCTCINIVCSLSIKYAFNLILYIYFVNCRRAACLCVCVWHDMHAANISLCFGRSLRRRPSPSIPVCVCRCAHTTHNVYFYIMYENKS